MFQLNRKTEYSLNIVAYMLGAGARDLHSARRIAENTRIPFDMVTKCLQRLHRREYCSAVQGKNGGYRLSFDPDLATLGEFMEASYEPVALTECINKGTEADCVLHDDCPLALPLRRLNRRISDLLDTITLSEFLAPAIASAAGFSQQPQLQSVSSDDVARPDQSHAL